MQLRRVSVFVAGALLGLLVIGLAVPAHDAAGPAPRAKAAPASPALRHPPTPSVSEPNEAAAVEAALEAGRVSQEELTALKLKDPESYLRTRAALSAPTLTGGTTAERREAAAQRIAARVSERLSEKQL